MAATLRDQGGSTPLLGAVRSRRRELARAMRGLEAALAAPAPGREAVWRAAVTHRLDVLRDAFDGHIVETERAGGLFDEIGSTTPRLSHAVASLRAEHEPIRTTIAETVEHLLPASEAAPGVERTRQVLIDLLVQIARHRQRGADLVWDAYWVDIGGESNAG